MHTINSFSKLDSFRANDPSHTPLRNKRTSGFPIYLVSTEMRHWLEMDYRLLIRQSYRDYIHQLSIYITHQGQI